jgi:hypothetical protein
VQFIRVRLVRQFGFYAPLPLLASKPIEQTPRRLNIEKFEKEIGASKRQKQSVFSSEVSAA